MFMLQCKLKLSLFPGFIISVLFNLFSTFILALYFQPNLNIFPVERSIVPYCASVVWSVEDILFLSAFLKICFQSRFYDTPRVKFIMFSVEKHENLMIAESQICDA